MNTRQISISISTLSPVHIGCDDVYEPSNFVIADGALHALDPADLADALTEAEQKQLAALAEQREPIGAIQRFFRDNAARFSVLSRHEVAVAPAIVSEYEKNAGKPTQRGAAGEATYNVFPIARTAYRPFDNAPYLPGSSLKGSIRTAWLNHLNNGNALTSDEKRDTKQKSNKMQQRLLNYVAGKFENDPFRHIALADAHPDAGIAPPPTRILYSISKKKRAPRDGEGGSPELKVFLESIPDALPSAFFSELRLRENKIEWNALCDACNKFYRPQLEAELNHPVLGLLIDGEWKKLIASLLANELNQLMSERQGFLLRVGRHSGAESVTLDGVRDIKILGKKGEQPSYRLNTTEKRFASLTKSGAANLLPFGWIWVDASDDAHRLAANEIRQKLAQHSAPLREDYQDRLVRREERQRNRATAVAEATAKKSALEAAAEAEASAMAARQAALEAMPANLRRIEEFKTAFATRAAQLIKGAKVNPNTEFHQKARDLAKAAHEGESWSAEEKSAAADAIELWLPQVVRIDIKDERKKLKLAALRGA